MKLIKLDECYSVSTERDSVILRYECITDKISPKSGEFEVSRDIWYYPNIKLALVKFLSESAADNKDVKSILRRIDEVEKLIDSKF
jgi:hypothetical protein